ncbi:MAG: hypothetical protein KIS89_04000 [Dokdonella sp.]|nr:hypothetical protein [Dokdonella sp.]
MRLQAPLAHAHAGAARAAARLPEAPAGASLHLVRDYLDDGALQTLQNRHLFHLCPSETEGFGRHLVEASASARSRSPPTRSAHR